MAERRADVDRDAITACVLHTPQMQDLGAARRHLQHLLVADPRDAPCARHDARIGGENPVDVRVNLTRVGAERRRERDCSRVGTTAAERGDVLAGLRNPLKTRHDGDRAIRERVADPARCHVDDASPPMHGIGDDARLRASERAALVAEVAIAIASSAIEIRSPAVSSMSSSRPGGSGLTCCARSRSSSVVSPIADTTTATEYPPSSLPRCAVRPS